MRRAATNSKRRNKNSIKDAAQLLAAKETVLGSARFRLLFDFD
jgi:hypothetical protein